MSRGTQSGAQHVRGERYLQAGRRQDARGWTSKRLARLKARAPNTLRGKPAQPTQRRESRAAAPRARFDCAAARRAAPFASARNHCSARARARAQFATKLKIEGWHLKWRVSRWPIHAAPASLTRRSKFPPACAASLTAENGRRCVGTMRRHCASVRLRFAAGGSPVFHPDNATSMPRGNGDRDSEGGILSHPLYPSPSGDLKSHGSALHTLPPLSLPGLTMYSANTPPPAAVDAQSVFNAEHAFLNWPETHPVRSTSRVAP
ncbi:hypothetical protein FGB62_71g21 [Gracilaria domingensis]|nr:hypothetical protein FGB62_71g21 [Gracilaria domingensis]